MSSDTRGFDLFAGGVRAVTSAWQTASGVAEMYAGENEDVQKSIQKLVAIQNIAMGVQELANELGDPEV
jgi:hypothetical protein